MHFCRIWFCTFLSIKCIHSRNIWFYVKQRYSNEFKLEILQYLWPRLRKSAFFQRNRIPYKTFQNPSMNFFFFEWIHRVHGFLICKYTEKLWDQPNKKQKKERIANPGKHLPRSFTWDGQLLDQRCEAVWINSWAFSINGMYLPAYFPSPIHHQDSGVLLLQHQR